MSNKHSKIVVVGAGAIGGTTAAFLEKGGWDPTVVCKHSDTVEKSLTEGFTVTGIKGKHRIPVKAVREISDIGAKADYVFLATKAPQCLAAAKELRPFIKEDSVVVSLQNGICEDALGEVLGRGRVMGCVVGWGASLHGPAILEVTSRGEFVIGNIDNHPDNHLSTVKQMLDTVAPTRISENIYGELYSKLIINSCINSLGVIVGVRLGELLANRKVRRIFIALMKEAMEVAGAMGIHVEKAGGGKLDYYAFLKGESPIKDIKRHLFFRVLGFKYRRIKSSSLQSLERGKRTEIDYLNGYIVEKAARHGVKTPLNSMVVQMIKQIEIENRPMGWQNLIDFRNGF